MPEGEASDGAKPAETLILNLQHPDCEATQPFLLFKLLSLQSSAMQSEQTNTLSLTETVRAEVQSSPGAQACPTL